MKILVAGGAGFIGSNLCRELLKNSKNEVICLDNEFTGSKDNISSLLENERFYYIHHDIIDEIKIAEKIDEIYNLACPASPVHYQGEAAIYTTKTCVLGILNVLELARKKNAKILQASTSEIYGEPLMHPQKESYWGNVNSIGIRSCYDEGKRCAESLLFDYNRTFGTKIKLIRIFNTYGPFMCRNDGRVVSNFICQALQNSDITIYGDGSQTRSFCYVDDLIKGIIKMMSTPDDFLGPVNLGNPDERTIKEIAQKVIDLTKSSSKIVFHPLPSDDPTRRCPDITKAEKFLNWKPKVNLEEGLVKTIEFFKNQ